MVSENGMPASMNQQIFSAQLSVETVSLYLLCCALVDGDTPITLEKIRERWNSSENALQESLKELLGKNILRKRLSDGSDAAVFLLTEHSKWQP